MSAKLNKEQILHEMLDVLIKGWGLKAVQDGLATLSSKTTSGVRGAKVVEPSSATVKDPKAVMLVLDLTIPEERKALLIEIAEAFDSGSAFQRTSDVRSFLAAHSTPVREIRSRDHAFRLMLPIFERMSEKGLARILSSSRHSGPAELGSISEAIKGTGKDLRDSAPDAADQSD